MKRIVETLESLSRNGNMRRLPDESPSGIIDLSSNDYLGLAADMDLRNDFLKELTTDNFFPSSSASRLLSSSQSSYTRLEQLLAHLYGRPALLFNSGYHANTGMIAALGGRSTLFVADKLVHASIIDGLTLSGSDFRRFRHNDINHLYAIIEQHGAKYERVVVVAESVYSMDGDSPDLHAIVDAKRLHPNCLVYIDEAHAVGVCGPQGLGLSYGLDVDIVVGTFGKALASMGAYAIMSEPLRRFMINRCRSLIFSTMLPPVVTDWSAFALLNALRMDDRRAKLMAMAQAVQKVTNWPCASHIQAIILGDAKRTVDVSEKMRNEVKLKILPIRTPTVPPGTERLRISLSASLPDDISTLLGDFIDKYDLTQKSTHNE